MSSKELTFRIGTDKCQPAKNVSLVSVRFAHIMYIVEQRSGWCWRPLGGAHNSRALMLFAIFSVHMGVCQSKLDSLLCLLKLWCPMKLLPAGTWHLNFTETERWRGKVAGFGCVLVVFVTSLLCLVLFSLSGGSCADTEAHARRFDLRGIARVRRMMVRCITAQSCLYLTRGDLPLQDVSLKLWRFQVFTETRKKFLL